MDADDERSNPDIGDESTELEPIRIPDAFPDLSDDADTAARADSAPLKSYRPKAGGSLIMAGMIGLANGMGLDDHRDETEIAIPFENDEDGLDFDFGKLPPL